MNIWIAMQHRFTLDTRTVQNKRKSTAYGCIHIESLSRSKATWSLFLLLSHRGTVN